MDVLRTPDSRFENLPDFDFEPHYVDIEDEKLGIIRVHYLDEGPRDGPIVLCMHGNPSWCYLYRKMIPVFVAAGFRVLAPDLVGFGRSDKPAQPAFYSYAKHVEWMSAWLTQVNATDITLVAQDWGGLIGLRMLTAMPERFAAASLSNTGLSTGDHALTEAFGKWHDWSVKQTEFDAGLVLSGFGRGTLTDAEINAYRAPFPDPSYAGHLPQFASLVPSSPDDPESENNREAWRILMQWKKPVLLCFSDGDPVTAGAEKVFMKLIPGAHGQPHMTLHGGHFIQETQGEAWAQAVIAWRSDK